MIIHAVLVCLSSLLCAQEAQKLESSSIRFPHTLGNVSVFHNEKKGFSIEQNGKRKRVAGYNIDAQLRGLPRQKLDAYLASGYLMINKNNNNEFIIHGKTRGNGGGPATAMVANASVKAVGYGVPIAAAGAVVAVVPGGTGIVTATVNFCNVSGITAGYIAAVESASHVAALWGLLSPTP